VSRYYDDGDATMPCELWEANVRRALAGKRGQKVLRDLREALAALPEPRLIEGALCTVGAARAGDLPERAWSRGDLLRSVEAQGEGVCAVGAYLWHREVRAGKDPAEAFAALPMLLDSDADLSETARLAIQAGVTFTLGWEIAYRNDETYEGLSPEERHARFLAWIDEQLTGMTP
jgi:hypothetical protein